MTVDPAVSARLVAQRAAADFVRVMYGPEVAGRRPDRDPIHEPGVTVRYAVGVLEWRSCGVVVAPVVVSESGVRGACIHLELVLRKDATGWTVTDVETSWPSR